MKEENIKDLMKPIRVNRDEFGKLMKKLAEEKHQPHSIQNITSKHKHTDVKKNFWQKIMQFFGE